MFGEVPKEASRRDQEFLVAGGQEPSECGGFGVFAVIDEGGGGSAIRPGAFVEVRFPDRLYSDVVQLPEASLFGGKIVYAVIERRLVARPVDVVGYAGDNIFVQGDALVPGEPILTTRFAEIGEGVLVDVRD